MRYYPECEVDPPHQDHDSTNATSGKEGALTEGPTASEEARPTALVASTECDPTLMRLVFMAGGPTCPLPQKAPDARCALGFNQLQCCLLHPNAVSSIHNGRTRHTGSPNLRPTDAGRHGSPERDPSTGADRNTQLGSSFGPTPRARRPRQGSPATYRADTGRPDAKEKWLMIRATATSFGPQAAGLTRAPGGAWCMRHLLDISTCSRNEWKTKPGLPR